MRVMRWMAVTVLLLPVITPGVLAAKERDEQSWKNLRQLQVGQKVQARISFLAVLERIR